MPRGIEPLGAKLQCIMANYNFLRSATTEGIIFFFGTNRISDNQTNVSLQVFPHGCHHSIRAMLSTSLHGDADTAHGQAACAVLHNSRSLW